MQTLSMKLNYILFSIKAFYTLLFTKRNPTVIYWCLLVPVTPHATPFDYFHDLLNYCYAHSSIILYFVTFYLGILVGHYTGFDYGMRRIKELNEATTNIVYPSHHSTYESISYTNHALFIGFIILLLLGLYLFIRYILSIFLILSVIILTAFSCEIGIPIMLIYVPLLFISCTLMLYLYFHGTNFKSNSIA